MFWHKKREIHLIDWLNQEQVEYWEKIGEQWIELDQSKEKYILKKVTHWNEIGASDEDFKERVGKQPFLIW